MTIILPFNVWNYINLLKKYFDYIFALLLLPLLLLLFLLIGVSIKLSSPGPIIHWSKRIGKNNIVFMMPKFRTMYLGTPNKATDKLANPDRYVTNFGKILRLTSLDELPQIYSILKGDMSFVGPRPALFNQIDLIRLRKKNGIDILLPGITGLAQIKGRDELTIKTKVDLDKEYMDNKSFLMDIKILCLTLFITIKRDKISH
jgi:O-antigen biosynthesis protein WbqP|tara:strand:+ start:772 stop:1377 length:606 start_codon:yes stop_codon:yes gene_type:complete